MNAQVKRIAVIGPECTGKSDLSEFLAEYFRTAWVPEYARHFIENLNRPYEKADLLTIAKGQLNAEDQLTVKANKIIICDTNLYVIKVWSEFKYGEVDAWILSEIDRRKYDLYLLTDIDIPWQEDPQREHPDKRNILFQLYRNEMLQQHVPFVVISGTREQRRATAISAIKNLSSGDAKQT